MTPRARRTLRDFDQEAIAHPADTAQPAAQPVAEPGQGEVPEHVASAEPAAARVKPAKTATAARSTTATTRTGLYFHPATFEAAKSAYLVDFDALPDSADSFARWVSAALDVHAGLTAEQRAAAAAGLPEEPRAGSGFTRSFELDDSTVQAMETAITEDRRAHRYVTRSQFSNEAVRVAIEAAKTRAGGVLPPAPARLPNRPVR